MLFSYQGWRGGGGTAWSYDFGRPVNNEGGRKRTLSVVGGGGLCRLYGVGGAKKKGSLCVSKLVRMVCNEYIHRA